MRRDTPDEALAALRERGVALADEDSVSWAIHDVYCGIMADHEHPNEDDRAKARRMMESLHARPN
jgi:hypothetical protein